MQEFNFGRTTVTFEIDSPSRLRQLITIQLLMLICAFPLLEARIQPAAVVSQGPLKPVSETLLLQSDFILTPASPVAGAKYERVWNSSFVHTLSAVQPTKLPRQIIREGDRPTSLPVHLMLISIESSSER
jgi:hypothetical protein